MAEPVPRPTVPSRRPTRPGIVENIRRATNAAATRAQDFSDFAPDNVQSCIELQINGAGESLITVEFKNVSYTEKPILIGFGGFVRDWDEEVEKTIIGRGEYPTVSVVVVDYTVEDTPPLKRIYKGAKIAVVTGGSISQKMIVNCIFSGTALIGPSDTTSTITANSEWNDLNASRPSDSNGETVVYNDNGNYI